MEKYEFRKTDHLVTAWDTFSSEPPGTCRRYVEDGIDIFVVHEKLIQQGMYEAKI